MYLVAPIKANQFTQYIHKAKNISQIGKKENQSTSLMIPVSKHLNFFSPRNINKLALPKI